MLNADVFPSRSLCLISQTPATFFSMIPFIFWNLIRNRSIHLMATRAGTDHRFFSSWSKKKLLLFCILFQKLMKRGQLFFFLLEIDPLILSLFRSSIFFSTVMLYGAKIFEWHFFIFFLLQFPYYYYFYFLKKDR